jgi:hypothetical protein
MSRFSRRIHSIFFCPILYTYLLQIKVANTIYSRGRQPYESEGQNNNLDTNLWAGLNLTDTEQHGWGGGIFSFIFKDA